jgi:hypothetical protein
MVLPSAELQQLTVIFIRLSDPMTPSVRKESQAVTEAISVAQQRIADVVHFYDGSVLKNLNDGVLAYFGHPHGFADQGDRAVLAGTQVLRALASVEAHRSLQARVGIATGMVVVDDFTVSGMDDLIREARNLAAPRPKSTDANTIVLADSTLKLVGIPLKLEKIRTNDLKSAALEQIERIAKVPPENRAAFRIEVTNLIIDFRDYERLLDPVFLAAAEKKLNRWKIELMKVAKARSLLSTAVLQLKSAIDKFNREFGEGDRCYIAPQPIERLLSELEGWSNSPPGIKADVATARKGRGRPSQPTHSHLHFFVSLLLVNVNANGGKLTFDKNYPTRGSLGRVLDLLRPHMHQGFIPEILPIRPLISAQKFSKGGFAAVDALISQRTPRFSDLKIIDNIVGARSGTENKV